MFSMPAMAAVCFPVRGFKLVWSCWFSCAGSWCLSVAGYKYAAEDCDGRIVCIAAMPFNERTLRKDE
jgi:hypothetical protein